MSLKSKGKRRGDGLKAARTVMDGGQRVGLKTQVRLVEFCLVYAFIESRPTNFYLQILGITTRYYKIGFCTSRVAHHSPGILLGSFFIPPFSRLIALWAGVVHTRRVQFNVALG